MSTKNQVLREETADQFHDLIGKIGEHGVYSGDEKYVQPHCYLSFHLVQMRSAGWDIDFDQVAAVSGASALFAFQPDDFMPKYAHLWIGIGDSDQTLTKAPRPMRGIDLRIAQATGFGYEWVDFEGIEGAWNLIVESVDAGKPLKGWDWEAILFAGYQDADQTDDRRIYAMADGPGTYAKWLNWAEFGEWAGRMSQWKTRQLGRHTERIDPAPPQDVARRVVGDLVTWSQNTPEHIRGRWPKALYGLEGIEGLASYLESLDEGEDYTACHPINGQWTIRNSTGVYLERLAKSGAFSSEANAHLDRAAGEYRFAYHSWSEMYEKHLGHGVPDDKRKTVAHHTAGAAAIRQALAHEKTALAELAQALAKMV
jgi:hypothetical protein